MLSSNAKHHVEFWQARDFGIKYIADNYDKKPPLPACLPTYMSVIGEFLLIFLHIPNDTHVRGKTGAKPTMEKDDKRNISSQKKKKREKPKEWTKEEMEEAEPYPLPEIPDEEEKE